MSNIFSMFNTIFNDAPEIWQTGFQDSATPGFSGIIELHDTIFFYLIIISVGVFWVFGNVMYNFSSSKTSLVHKYLNHGTLIETVWTILPALILIAIAFPSFRLLYLLDLTCFNYEQINIGFIFSMPILNNTSNSKIKNKKDRKPYPLHSINSINNQKTDCTSIIPYNRFAVNPLFSYFGNIGIKFSSISRKMTVLYPYPFYQIIGHMLGDGSMEKDSPNANPRFIFGQALEKYSYSFVSFLGLSYLCQSFPGISKGMRKGRHTYKFLYKTRNYPVFNFVHTLFYKKINQSWVKYISDDLILYLSPRALAFWFMDDGSKPLRGGVKFHINAFTFQDAYKLAGMLHYAYGLNVTIQKQDNKPLIYIKSESFEQFKSIVLPHMHPSMYYKLGI